MKITIHGNGNTRIAELVADEVLIQTPDEALQLIMDLHYQDFDKMIIREKNITPAFFDLKTGVAGEILQKFSNYRSRLVIIGDFSKYPGKSIRDFIYESNKGRQVNFMDSLEAAIGQLLK
ncbi:protein of unknown function [Chitinophaga ginsengisegetis]|uniref:DUF4180 domain-containing protein n=1 Tax=Chitinophaga ginsengisegetis TaxID=393003 RepID=A0A1T5PA01_9BACT|nr:DUF4180 domain-containing protein [Chitinophaga ginsengisegetis]MDR6568975.1 hypothetical protein [Chitinophaga ginsengisegetis]MDR6648996.1 hypothetical protein [Chitinophaga ginsengisegetis]MDR6655056.1 hypothetical protein [Chitinophaga ginsengisegetis]SKD09496.1 protein of unknown function [Chitinophaga ginsengisegetis]